MEKISLEDQKTDCSNQNEKGNTENEVSRKIKVKKNTFNINNSLKKIQISSNV